MKNSASVRSLLGVLAMLGTLPMGVWGCSGDAQALPPESASAPEIRQSESYFASFTTPPPDAPHAEEVRTSILEQVERFTSEYSGAKEDLGTVARLDIQTTSHESKDFLTYLVQATEDVGGASAVATVRSL